MALRTTSPFLAWRFQCILGMSGSVVAEKPRLTRFGKTYPTQFQHNPALSLSASCKRTCLLDFKPCSPIAEHVSIGGEAGMIAFINLDGLMPVADNVHYGTYSMELTSILNY
ncbi:uncharacterized protein EI90DRAFT_2611026 [Cantharellus anzutake]|uniref:uncharacterized protein n=1 Tax=Cantharellus anzutake TaxID=1750568 RepID=UPI001905E749|nr:uncharacterized protein EI90DRAFT_2611026 [Cantharellus anzutake]KAF8320215.1 hypothetical protein EI90DRAFT_2611026 [Cantharellus anzutake]